MKSNKTCYIELLQAEESPKTGENFIRTRSRAVDLLSYRALLAIGGSKSGKSRLLENWAQAAAKALDAPLIYLATLQADEDPENQARIARHQAQRAGKGFHSLEIAYDLTRQLDEIPQGSVVLLECLGTLLANECFDPANADRQALWQDSAKLISDSLLADLAQIMDRTGLLLIAANDVFCDGEIFTGGTRTWLEANGLILQGLAQRSDLLALEVSAGLPLMLHKRSQTVDSEIAEEI
ncbi:MAG: bifunctional adenosylcobinamide kinase/adenosylcobinamide-phosphate guanylyltransferase [Eubacteriales bacterium]|nr:bifunctional adenosylcobinamide kinase/adenosylcobinamide-phosphate guanylyltransferase [Eubacteriales bacterium]